MVYFVQRKADERGSLEREAHEAQIQRLQQARSHLLLGGVDRQIQPIEAARMRSMGEMMMMMVCVAIIRTKCGRRGRRPSSIRAREQP